MTRHYIKPTPGDVLVYHTWNGEDVLLLYVFRRPEGAYVLLDLEWGVLVDVGCFVEGPNPTEFKRWE